MASIRLHSVGKEKAGDIISNALAYGNMEAGPVNNIPLEVAEAALVEETMVFEKVKELKIVEQNSSTESSVKVLRIFFPKTLNILSMLLSLYCVSRDNTVTGS